MLKGNIEGFFRAFRRPAPAAAYAVAEYRSSRLTAPIPLRQYPAA
jgi:hypothetical protein